jgi:RpiR family carbohydrate utilization transcriptional regulator
MAQLGAWLDSLVLERKVSAGTKAVLKVIELDPAAASYLSAQKMASRAAVNVATVVRTAQFLGFSGWPALKLELRHRYLATMTSEGLLTEHAATNTDASIDLTHATLANDLDNLTVLSASIDPDQVKRIAAAIAQSRRTLVIATGSYAGPGIQLSHLGQMMGHDIELITSSGTSLVNRLRVLGPEDSIFFCNLWRSSTFVSTVAELSKERGARLLVLADRRTALSDLAEEAIIVPSEGVSFVPSVVGAVSAIQAILAELAAIDPERTISALREVETLWSALDLVDPV